MGLKTKIWPRKLIMSKNEFGREREDEEEEEEEKESQERFGLLWFCMDYYRLIWIFGLLYGY